MRNTIKYEWSREIEDEFGDITDISYQDKLSELGLEGNLLLVRFEGNDIDGLVDTLYAYVKDNKLPLLFEEAGGHIVNVHVPKRFDKELATWLKTQPVNSK